MTANFLIALAELLRECPMCHKVSLDDCGSLDISSTKAIRTCKCGYKIELDITEGKEEPKKTKILNENIKNMNDFINRNSMNNLINQKQNVNVEEIKIDEQNENTRGENNV